MSTLAAETPARPTPVIVHLSGRYRGKTHRLWGDHLHVGTGPDAEIRFSAFDLTPGMQKLPVDKPFAVLEHRGNTYELRAAPDADIWVNGVRTDHIVLQSGDVIEVGQGGPVLRFRLYAPGTRPYKSVSEVFSDCIHCARHGKNTVDRAGILLAGPPMELLTQTTPLVRILVAAFLVVVVAGIGMLWVRNIVLEKKLEAEEAYVRGLADLLERDDQRPFSVEEVDDLRREMESRLALNAERIGALEDRAGARGRVISTAARSVIFLQGAYGYDNPDGRALRFVGLGPDGTPLRGPSGEPEVTLEGNGPLIEIFYTGTAFVVTQDGFLLTNRHVALPWEYDAPTPYFLAQGFTPVMRRFVGYLPGVEEPFEVEFVRAADSKDVALLRCEPIDDEIVPLELTETMPRVGDEVIVMGYPTGLQALLARAEPEVIQELLQPGSLDFWELARNLSARGYVAPLATVGAITQLTSGSVVYDAETTHGGSGGPVLNLDGKVLAVNAAILPQFSGSNLGIPAAEALRLLRTNETPETKKPEEGDAFPEG